ncbi:MAG TPA: PepSY domain-containing protein, partial [Clostridia bacterium]|nr:PepSY domain-containing protein [Clostridia bacterium]
ANTSTYIGIEKVKEILLLRVPGATIAEIDLEYDDGKVKYEGEMYLNNLEYEFEINAVTGAVLDWESDSNDDSELDDENDDSDNDDENDDSDDDDEEYDD